MPLLRHTGVAIYASCAQMCNTTPDLVSVLIFLLPLLSGPAKLKNTQPKVEVKRKCIEVYSTIPALMFFVFFFPFHSAFKHFARCRSPLCFSSFETPARPSLS